MNTSQNEGRGDGMERSRSGQKKLVWAAILLLWALAVGAVLWRSLTKTASAGARQLPVYSVETEQKRAALTFNCAWDETGLDELLAILKAHDVKSTFFVVGDFAQRLPDAVRKIYNAGHEIGNHSMTHKDPVKMAYADLLSDISACNDLLYSLTGETVTLYRAPSGSYNDDTVEAARSLGMTAVQWDADSVDWKDKTPEEITERMLKKIGPGSISLFHVGKENTVAALPGVIEALQGQGYSFCTVTELLPEGELRIDGQGRARAAEG